MKKHVSLLVYFVGLMAVLSATPNYFIFQGVGSSIGTSKVLDTPMGTDRGDQLYLLANGETQYPCTALTTPGANNVIIGHSQGGLRALAWTGFCAQSNGQYPVPSTVITVSGPNLGDSTLLQGVGTLKNGINNIQQIVVNGIKNASNINIPQYLGSVDPNWLSSILSGFNYFTSFSNDPSTTSLGDMTPGSAFIKNYIGGASVSLTTKIVDGIPVIISITITPTPKIPASVNIGQIVGTDKDLLDFASSEAPPGLPIPTDPASLHQMVSLAASAAGASEAGWEAAEAWEKIVEGVDYVFSGINPDPYNEAVSLYWSDNASANAEASFYDLLANYQTYWDGLIGSSESDGFIAESDTGVQLQYIGGQSINPQVYPNGIYTVPPKDTAYPQTVHDGILTLSYYPSINHNTIARDNTVWGTQTPGALNPANSYNQYIGADNFIHANIYTGGVLQQMLGLTTAIQPIVVQ